MLNRNVFGKKHFIVELILLITTLDSAGGASHLKSDGRGRLLSIPVMAESAKYTQEIKSHQEVSPGRGKSLELSFTGSSQDFMVQQQNIAMSHLLDSSSLKEAAL